MGSRAWDPLGQGGVAAGIISTRWRVGTTTPAWPVAEALARPCSFGLPDTSSGAVKCEAGPSQARTDGLWGAWDNASSRV